MSLSDEVFSSSDLPVRGSASYIIPVMKEVRKLIEEGKRQLFASHAQKSMNTFKTALSLCPAEERMCMGEMFFFLGLSFRNLGHREYALRCWENAAFVRDPSSDPESKDWRVFHTIQVSRYLLRKGTGQFDTLAESDMIHDLIKMTWHEICDLEGLEKMDFYHRCDYYRTIRIAFPEIAAGRIGSDKEKEGQIVPFSKSKR